MRNAEDRPLVGEVVIVLILGYRRQQQQAEDRGDHHTDEDEDATIAVHGAGHHLSTITKATAKVRTRCSLLARISVADSVTRLECAPKNPVCCRPPAPPR